MEEEKNEIRINLGTFCLIILCLIIIVVGLVMYILKLSNSKEIEQITETKTSNSNLEKTDNVESTNKSQSNYLEGQYFFNGDFFTDVGGYIFNSDYSVTFSDNRIVKGTYSIEGNNLIIKFENIILPGESTESEVEESEIKDVIKEFVIVDEETIKSKNGDFEYFKIKNLKKSALVGTWKIQNEDISNGYIVFKENGEYTDSITGDNDSGTYTINENEVILKSTNRETILHYLSEKAMLFQAENIVLEKTQLVEKE